jgi:cytochrome P450
VPRTLLAYSRAPLEAFTRLAREHGDITQFMGPPMRAFLINQPSVIEAVLGHDAWNFQPMRVLIQRRLAPQGVAYSAGYLHQHHRQLLDPIFQEQQATQRADTIVIAATRAGARWQAGQTLDIQPAMLEVALATLAGLLCGAGVWQNQPELAALNAVGDYVARRSTYPWGVIPEYVPLLPDNRRFWRALAVVRTALRLRIAERRVSGDDRGDVLALLLGARAADTGRELTDAQALDNAITIMFAGAIPIGQSLAWTWHLLARHPEVEARLHAELEQVLADRPPTADDLARLAYTRMVVDESLRLYPVSWILGRNVVSDYVIDNYVLPSGSIVVLCPYVTQRDARFFDDPDAFVPERWAPAAQPRWPAGAYYPFAAGQNSCLGRQWAPALLTLTLATLARAWRMRSEQGRPLALDPLFVLRAKHGLPMRLERRAGG